MAFTIDETFEVRTSVEQVWRYLVDARQVVECLPGAELTAAQDDRTFLGKVKVKVGPVVASYSGKARFAEVNDQEHRIQIVADGRESAGSGSAKLTMTATVTALTNESGSPRSNVHVHAELDLAGKIVQFGRGMIETVNRQLFSQFAACVRSRLEAPLVTTDTATSDVTTTASAAEPQAPAANPVVITPADATRVTPSTSSTEYRPAQARSAEPVHLLPLLWQALRESLSRWFGRTSRS